ncbi:4'-phosphopantetheinyl transferase family protein [Promicromonospora sp. NPDC060271]|uniref:4'-phosphopantetheinyl transferase family protein n=1 Tax=Promicromonospora sp. NPDC060271 TaxID=3347089 RepID=UPI003666C89B
MSTEVWWSSLAAADRDLLGLLDGGERARVESLDRSADRGRSMVGAALLRVAVGAHLGTAPADVVVDRTCAECGGPHGAPRIAGTGTAAPSVSVSHSGLLAVVALVPRGPVGVDVQRLADLADPADGPAWATREALFKAGTPARGDVAIAELRPPLPGYAAVLVTPAGPAGTPRITHWPRPIRA